MFHWCLISCKIYLRNIFDNLCDKLTKAIMTTVIAKRVLFYLFIYNNAAFTIDYWYNKSALFKFCNFFSGISKLKHVI